MLEESVKHVDAFIAPSRFSKKKHLEMGLNIPIVHLPYFSPWPQEVEPASHECLGETPYFLFVGRLEKIKGLQTLIPVFRHHRKARLLIVPKVTIGR